MFALIGGDRAFWIRTIGKSGTATVTVSAQGIGEQVLTFDVVKK